MILLTDSLLFITWNYFDIFVLISNFNWSLGYAKKYCVLTAGHPVYNSSNESEGLYTF